MLGLVVFGSRTWMCTIAAPALAASSEDCAICSGVTGTAGFLPGVSADPVTAQEMITFRAIFGSLRPSTKHLGSYCSSALGRHYRVAAVGCVKGAKLESP